MRICLPLAGLAVVLSAAAVCQISAAHVPSSAFAYASDPPACPAQFDDSLESNGIASDFRHGVTRPIPTRQPEAELTNEARRVAHDAIARHQVKTWQAFTILSLVVGQDGLPTDICVKRPAGYGLDAQAVKAAAQYRFEPATAKSQPVRARIAMVVTFKVY
jgi:TonB family protein